MEVLNPGHGNIFIYKDDLIFPWIFRLFAFLCTKLQLNFIHQYSFFKEFEVGLVLRIAEINFKKDENTGKITNKGNRCFFVQARNNNKIVFSPVKYREEGD